MTETMQITKEMMTLNVNEIRTNPHQPRGYFDEGKMVILTDSIKEGGLKTPIEVVWDKRDDGKKATLKDGERRLRALIRAGYTLLQFGIHYIYKDPKTVDLEYDGLIAFCMREDLQPSEKGKAILNIFKRRGITSIEMAINAVNRAKDWIDNGFMAEPSSRNFFVSKEIIEKVAKDMKMIGVSGTNAVDLLKITRLPQDIQKKIFFAPPNSKIIHEAMKIGRHGDMVKRQGNDRGEFIPISFGRELARLTDDKMVRFFLRTALERSWTQRKLTLMVNDYLGSNLTPEAYIEAYERGCKQSVRAKQRTREEIDGITTSMDNMASTLTSWRTMNLVAMADAFKQKEFAISGKGLLSTTIRLKTALEETLLSTIQLAKVQEADRKILNIPFRVELTTPPKQRFGFRFSIPSDLGKRIDAETGDTLEIMIVAVIKPTGEKDMKRIALPPVEITKKQQK
jgi:ParB/RepB/Spo0J family partition protein